MSHPSTSGNNPFHLPHASTSTSWLPGLTPSSSGTGYDAATRRRSAYKSRGGSSSRRSTSSSEGQRSSSPSPPLNAPCSRAYLHRSTNGNGEAEAEAARMRALAATRAQTRSRRQKVKVSSRGTMDLFGWEGGREEVEEGDEEGRERAERDDWWRGMVGRRDVKKGWSRWRDGSSELGDEPPGEEEDEEMVCVEEDQEVPADVEEQFMMDMMDEEMAPCSNDTLKQT